MDRTTLKIDPAAHRLRRVGRLARRRMRIEGADLINGRHTDGRLTVEISGLGAAAAGAPETFEWTADRPIALVIVRSGIDGDDVSFLVGPATSGSGLGALVGDGTGIRYIAFCYDAEPDVIRRAPGAVSEEVAPARRSVFGRLLRAPSPA